jgi:hypothetical protein
MQWETIRKIFRSSHGQRRRSAPQALCGTQIGVAKALRHGRGIQYVGTF